MLEAALGEMGQNLPVVLSNSRGWRARPTQESHEEQQREAQGTTTFPQANIHPGKHLCPSFPTRT